MRPIPLRSLWREDEEEDEEVPALPSGRGEEDEVHSMRLIPFISP